MKTEQILNSLVTCIPDAHATEELDYEFLHPNGRRFEIRRFERHDGKKEFFLAEFIPSGRILKFNSQGHCIRSDEDPRIKEAEKTVGPNGFLDEMRRIGIDPKTMGFYGGGLGVFTIYLYSLEECAEAIAKAIDQNVRYKHCIDPNTLPAPSKIKMERMESAASHAYWEAESRASDLAWRNGEGLFAGCYSSMSGEIAGEFKKAILSYLNAPSQEMWVSIRGYIIAGHVTLWQAWCAVDKDAPRSGLEGFPSSEVLRNAIRKAAEDRKAEVQTKSKGTSATGLKLIL